MKRASKWNGTVPCGNALLKFSDDVMSKLMIPSWDDEKLRSHIAISNTKGMGLLGMRLPDQVSTEEIEALRRQAAKEAIRFIENHDVKFWLFQQQAFIRGMKAFAGTASFNFRGCAYVGAVAFALSRHFLSPTGAAYPSSTVAKVARERISELRKILIDDRVELLLDEGNRLLVPELDSLAKKLQGYRKPRKDQDTPARRLVESMTVYLIRYQADLKPAYIAPILELIGYKPAKKSIERAMSKAVEAHRRTYSEIAKRNALVDALRADKDRKAAK